MPIDGWEIGKSGDMEMMKKEYHDYCLKSKSNNIISCPKKIIEREKDKNVQWINEYFKNIGKKTEGKGKKRNQVDAGFVVLQQEI